MGFDVVPGLAKHLCTCTSHLALVTPFDNNDHPCECRGHTTTWITHLLEYLATRPHYALGSVLFEVACPKPENDDAETKPHCVKKTLVRIVWTRVHVSKVKGASRRNG